MIGSFMEGGKVLTASLLPLQNLLLRYAQQYKDYEVSQKALSAKIETLENKYHETKSQFQVKTMTLKREYESVHQALQNEICTLQKQKEYLVKENRFLELKRKRTVENAEEKSQIIASEWKTQLLDCFDAITRYFSFHGKRGGKHSLLYSWLGSYKEGSWLKCIIPWPDKLNFTSSSLGRVMKAVFNMWLNDPFLKTEESQKRRYEDAIFNKRYREDITVFFKYVRDMNAHYGDDPTIIPKLVSELGDSLPTPFRHKVVETTMLLAFDEISFGGFKEFLRIILEVAPSNVREDLANYLDFAVARNLLEQKVVKWPDRNENTLSLDMIILQNYKNGY